MFFLSYCDNQQSSQFISRAHLKTTKVDQSASERQSDKNLKNKLMNINKKYEEYSVTCHHEGLKKKRWTREEIVLKIYFKDNNGERRST